MIRVTVLALLLVLGGPVEAGWRKGASLPGAVPDAVAARDGQALYVMSGALGAGMRPFFELYDLRGDGWRPLTPIPRLASRFGLAAGRGRVFVTGGVDGTSKLTDGLWMYAPETAFWIELGALMSPRAGHASLVVDDNVLVVGGIGPQASAVESYSLTTGKWRRWPTKMPRQVADAAATRFGDELVLAGGMAANGRDVAAVQAVNVNTGAWRRLPNLPQAASGGALVVLADGLHYLGGYSQASQSVLSQHYRLSNGVWQARPPLPQGRHQMAYGSDNQRAVLIGGALGGGFYALFTGSDTVSIYQPSK